MKKYVKVSAVFDSDGNLMPENIVWDSSHSYMISRITGIRCFSADTVEKSVIRYTCVILGREKYLFYDRNRWYVETKEPKKA